MINIINFLPTDYMERRSRRWANLKCLAIAGLGLLLVGGASGYVLLSMHEVAKTRLAVEQQFVEAGRQIDQLKKLEEDKANLLRKVELSTDLLERVPKSLLLAHLVNYLPANTSLMGLTAVMEDVAPATDKKAAAAAKTPRKDGDEVRGRVCTFRIEGLALTDGDVAEYISRLCNDPLFSDVDLQFTEEFPYKEGVQMRRFQLGFHLRPEAEKRVADLKTVPLARTSAPAKAKGES